MSHRPLVDPRHAVLRVAVSTAASAVATALASWAGLRVAPLLGWNVGGLVMLLLAWSLIIGADEDTTRDRAGSEDPGRTLVYVVVIVASSVSLIAALEVTRHVAAWAPREAALAEVMCLVTVALAWGLTHTAFTLRYAHLYYRDDNEGVGGVLFPGEGRPNYFDFAYFAFTIGMCFQTSDVCVTSRQIRRAVLLHAVISFGYNTAIIAFVLNLVFGKVS
jgi:uncharacterized membrane protein